MKTIPVLLIVAALAATSVRIHSQNKPMNNSGAVLVQMKAANEALIARQAATLEILKTMENDSDQMRIIAKKK